MDSEFKPVKLRLKIDFVSHPAWAEGLGKYEFECLWNLDIVQLLKHSVHQTVFLDKEK